MTARAMQARRKARCKQAGRQAERTRRRWRGGGGLRGYKCPPRSSLAASIILQLPIMRHAARRQSPKEPFKGVLARRRRRWRWWRRQRHTERARPGIILVFAVDVLLMICSKQNSVMVIISSPKSALLVRGSLPRHHPEGPIEADLTIMEVPSLGSFIAVSQSLASLLRVSQCAGGTVGTHPRIKSHRIPSIKPPRDSTSFPSSGLKLHRLISAQVTLTSIAVKITAMMNPNNANTAKTCAKKSLKEVVPEATT